MSKSSSSFEKKWSGFDGYRQDEKVPRLYIFKITGVVLSERVPIAAETEDLGSIPGFTTGITTL